MNKKEIDKAELDEIFFAIINDDEHYRQQIGPIVTNLARKKVKGVFDYALSLKLWNYAVIEGIRRYNRHNRQEGGPIIRSTQADKNYVAGRLAAYYAVMIDDEVEEQVLQGQKKVRKNPIEDYSADKKIASNQWVGDGQGFYCSRDLYEKPNGERYSIRTSKWEWADDRKDKKVRKNPIEDYSSDSAYLRSAESVIDNWINGNLSDAKKKAKRFSHKQIREALMDFAGYRLDEAADEADKLKA